MKSRFFPILLLIVLVVFVFFIKECVGTGFKDGSSNSSDLDRHAASLEYTHHARCRMECRHITEEEIKEILHNGKVNYRKSETGAKPCPTYALEGYTQEHQHLRVVFAQCAVNTKVITAIDLDREWQCDCPGDNKRH